MVKYPLSNLLKARHTNEPISNILTDRIDNLIVWLLANFTKITPNQVTTLSLFFGIAAAFCFFNGLLFFGALLYFARHLSDGVDGRLSRLTEQGSKFGAWLDNYTGIHVSFLCILGFCTGQYLATGKLIWLIFAPLLMQSFRMHNWASMKVAILLGDKFKGKVVKSEDKNKGFIEKLKKFLAKAGAVEPFNSADGAILLFVLNPIIGDLLGISAYIVIFWLAVIALKEIFWFFYYRNILNRLDKEEEKQNKNKINKSTFEK